MRGSCLCGAVRFEFGPLRRGVHVCHCSACRKLSGSAHTAVLLAERGSLRWFAGRDRVRTFSRPTGLRRSFCAICGSAVPDAEPDVEGLSLVPAGTLDEGPRLEVLWHTHVRSKASWEEIAGPAPRWDEEAPCGRPASTRECGAPRRAQRSS